MASVFFGAGLGFMLNRFRKKSSSRFRNICVTTGLCLFSGTAAALTAAVICSGPAIFKEVSVYFPVGILAVLLTLAVRFPRAAGFPLLLVSGVLTVLLAYSFLRYPLADGSGRVHVTRDLGAYVHILCSPGESSVSFLSNGDDDVLEFYAYRISLNRNFPFLGGVSRGLIAEIRRNNEAIFRDTRVNLRPAGSAYPDTNGQSREVHRWFFSIWEDNKKLAIKDLNPGMGLTVCLEPAGMAFL